ncbi:MAG: type II secretion system F family protein [Candidatus Moraniibacteriota bacterium]
MVSHVEKLLFTRELAVLLKSGVSLGDSLESLQDKSHRGGMRDIIDGVLHDVQNGQLLSHALSRFPKVFDQLYLNLVRIGETSGTLKENLDFLSRQLEGSYTLRKKIQSIILYPTIVLTMAFVLGAGISVFILPRLISLFSSFDVVLPLSTRILLQISAFMSSYGVAFFVTLFFFFFLFRVFIVLPKVRPYWHQFLLSLPGLSGFFQDIAVAHFCRDMGVMIESGLPILEALLIEEKVMENRAIAKLIASLAIAVSEGKTIADELSKDRYKLISPLAVKMIASGEKTGKLGETFLFLDTFFEAEVDRRIKNMTVFFEPILLLIIGLLVAFLALAILTPIYSLTGSVKR